MPEPARYRTGRHNRPFVYLQEGPEPADSDPLVCVVWPPFAGAQIAALLNDAERIVEDEPDEPDEIDMQPAVTTPVPPAERNTPAEVIADALPVDPDDDTVIVSYRTEPCRDERCEGCRPAALPQWGAPETVANQIVGALSAAGYRIVKANPTVADLAAEQGVTPLTDPATLAFDPPLTDGERDGFMAALAELRGEYGEFEWAVRYDEGVVRVKDDRKHAEDCARIVNRSEGPPAQVVQRRVGPWTPVDEENRSDG